MSELIQEPANLAEMLYKKGEQVAWLIIKPAASGDFDQELILGALTDDVSLLEGDEAHPVYLNTRTDNSELLEALKNMTSLALVKWGNLDKEVYAEIEKAMIAISNAEK